MLLYQADCYDHRDVSKVNGTIDEKVHSVETPNDYMDESGMQQNLTATKVNGGLNHNQSCNAFNINDTMYH